MSNQTLATVLVVDDSPIDMSFLVSGLSDSYAVIVANNGAMALEMAYERQPDVILMDVSMPGLNGYECCRQLKQQERTQNIEVIFVSAHDSVAEKVKGYDAGGSDYVVKPVVPSELKQKVRVAVEHKHQRDVLYRHQDQAKAERLTTTEELSVVVDFLRDASTTGAVSELASYLLAALKGYQLSGCILINFSKGQVINATHLVTPLEKTLLLQIAGTAQVIEDGQRMMRSYGQVAVLIRDMPTDPELIQRYSHYIDTLLRETDRFLQSIETKLQLSTLISDVQSALLEVNQEHERNEAISQDLFDRLLTDIQHAFDDWGLTESQEKLLLNLVNQSMTNLLQCYEVGANKGQRLHSVLDRLFALS